MRKIEKFEYQLSILIPTYNREKYLNKALNSFFEQINEFNYKKIELLISDNCSKDKTQIILEKYMKKFPKLKYEFWKNKKKYRSR